MLDFIKQNLLKIVLLADGAFCLAAGILLATLPSPIGGLIGPAFTSGSVLGIGVFLIAWGVFHLALGGTAVPSTGAVRLASLGDGVWIAASAGIIFINWNGLTTFGVVAIAVVAVAVADILLLKLLGLGGRHRPATA